MNCHTCQSDKIKFCYKKNGYDFYNCNNCSLLFVWPIPKNLDKNYQENYFENNNLKNLLGYIDYEKRQKPMKKIFNKYLKIISTFSDGHKIFDIGAASGHFLKLAKNQNWKTLGIDISKYAANKAKENGENVVVGDFLKINIDEKFDVITMWDVIEHVNDPISYIKKINKSLNRDGLLALTTVDRNSLWAKITGKFWHLIIPPEHLFYFSKKSLTQLLEKNNFEILIVKKIGRRSYLPQILKTLYRWQGLKIWDQLYQYASQHKLFNNLVIPFNLRDNLFLIARKKPDIAVFHNFLDNIGGAEIVSLTLAQELGADIYSTNFNQDKINKLGFQNIKIKSIGQVPINAPIRQQLSLWRFSKLNLKNKYKHYIISGDWAVSASKNNKPNLWYVHSPIREIWDLYDYTKKHNVPKIGWWLFDLWVIYNRYLNKKYVKNIDIITCNSINTKKRIKKYLNKEAEVINPPIDTKQFYYQKNGDFWLSVNRLITHKRVEMQLEAFRNMPDEKLIIVGSYEKSTHFKKYASYIKAHKPDNVEIISWVDQKQLAKLYANCKAFITTSKDEDFGMTVVEAMASGKPVIAPNEGGYKETIINNTTGILIDDINSEKLIEAMKLIKINPEKYRLNCEKRAQDFDTKIFIQKIKKNIKINN